ncbi:MAG: NADH-quinone oxidoreductase subunit K [Anaerolineaceae bacterium]|nr:NADH-quinone oxidoreductase subunit K [Anaerolineaceae bacterium]
MNLTPVQIILMAAFLLAGIGLYGLLISRNLIKVVVALQVMTKGALLALVVAGSMQDQVNLAQSMTLMVIIVDTIVAVAGLALAVQVRRHIGTLDIKALTTLKR